jgi:hypothetical protein
MSSPLEPAAAFSPGPFDAEECGFDGAAALSVLDQPRQILVFQTLQDALNASPPRHEATFARVVKAYTTLTQVVASAANGRLVDAELGSLQQDIEIAGGVIAPGLKSTGDGSLAEFRAATFGLLDQGYDEAVVVAIYAALNARLKASAIEGLDSLFQVVAAFFADFSSSANNSQALQVFAGLDVGRQVLVFESMKAGILSQPPRRDATFSNLVAAYSAERDVLLSAQQGALDDICLARLENCLVEAGGVIEPGIWAHGRSSVAAFRSETFRVLQQLLPVDVLQAAVKSLNAGLRESRPVSILQVFSIAKSFFSPLLNENWDSQTMRSFRGLSLASQALVFETIEISLRVNPGLEPSIFASAVKAVAQERFVVDSAGNGMLDLDMLLDLKDAIELCGGEIAPGIRSEGPGSVAEFCDQCFVATSRVMSKSVYDAAMAALNASLKASSIQSLSDVVSAVKRFTAPFSVVKSQQNAVDVIPGSEVRPVAASDAVEADVSGRDGSSPESPEFSSGSDSNVIGVEADSPVLPLSSEGYGECVDGDTSDLHAEQAGETVDSADREPSARADWQAENPSSEQEGLEASDDLPSRYSESDKDFSRPSAYPIFSLNIPAVHQDPAAGLSSPDD